MINQSNYICRACNRKTRGCTREYNHHSGRCNICDVELTDDNWYKSSQKSHHYVCKKCRLSMQRIWHTNNREKNNLRQKQYRYEHGEQPMSENKTCPMYLGVHIAERVLSLVFKDVKRMPPTNPGYDFICNKGKLIDVKSGCLKANGKNLGMWTFIINKNTIADYFLCMAFDNRENLNPMHLWLLPSAEFNDKKAIGISLSTIHKWDKYELNISKVVKCCDIIS